MSRRQGQTTRAAQSTRAARGARPAQSARTAPSTVTAQTAQTASQPLDMPERIGRFLAEWTPTAGGILLGLVLAWFGYHELVQPAPWTGYVPVLDPSSSFAVALVLIHGWVLLVLAVAVFAGVMPRTAAVIAAVLLAEIVISLAIKDGLSDLVLRDVGVFGLAVCLAGASRRRFVLTR